MNNMDLQNRVKEIRTRIGLKQADLAENVGVTRQTIIAIEKGRLNPSIVISLKIARILREPVDYIFFLQHGGSPVAHSAEAKRTGARALGSGAKSPSSRPETVKPKPKSRKRPATDSSASPRATKEVAAETPLLDSPEVLSAEEVASRPVSKKGRGKKKKEESTTREPELEQTIWDFS